MGKIRVFAAIELVDAIKSEIGKFQDELRKVKADIKWVRLENIHLTLKFFGYIPEEQVLVIEKELEKITENVYIFSVLVEKIGSFPVSGNPKIVWAGINDPANQIVNLQKYIEASLKKLGFASEEHSYTPHLTIGRIKGKNNLKNLLQLIKEKDNIKFGSMIVKDISIIKSDLKSEGPLYTVLKKIALKDKI